ncbi:MAG: 4-hydroxy-tetrahydrodipicolinate reductase [Maribacter sp.]
MLEVLNMDIILIGYGRMGKAIEGFAIEKGHKIVLKIDKENLEKFNPNNLKKADVAIDFSLPHSAFNNIKTCIDTGVPVISGTTGWTEKLPELQQYCKEKNGTFLYASNFSIGVNIFFEINQLLARLMDNHSQYDVSMEEIHHVHKLDSPSGTGITLANQIIQHLGRKTKWKEIENADKETLGIHSKRIELTPGTHAVQYSSEIDTIDIIHTAHSRDGFAKGALLAAEWIANKKGVFGMKDVLGL